MQSVVSSLCKPDTNKIGGIKLAPAEFLVGMTTNEAIGSHCLEYTHPEFRNRVKRGASVVVAGKAFGCGSSREQAAAALLGS